ncbi:MAG: hypothetical protein E7664_00635 [Ruminococcaceae bacterium]|nr:hypothetical protein [Oscillospiraceae bacterium]
MGLGRWLLGETELVCPSEALPALLQLCAACGFAYRRLVTEGEQSRMRMRYGTARLFLSVAEKREIPLRAEAEHGLPPLCRRYRRRAGLLVGAVLFMLILYVSMQTVWDVRIIGEERLQEREVLSLLRENGLHAGASKREIDIDVLENKILILSDDISWISINLLGTVAEVQIRESVPAPEADTHSAANLVASEDAVIEMLEDVRGEPAVAIGDAVRKGDLLVSGLYGSERHALRYTLASGRVLGRVERSFEANIPLTYERKVYTGRTYTEKYLVFFEKEIKIFGLLRHSHISCDIIEVMEYLHTPRGESLPVGIRTVRHAEYRTETAQRTEEQARALAEYRLRCDMAAWLSAAELRYRSLEGVTDGDVYRLRCDAVGVENIAEVRYFDVVP